MPSSLQPHELATACQASLSLTISQSLLKLMCIESMMPSNHLILCHPLFLLPSIFPTSGPMGWYKYSSLKETMEGEIKKGEIKKKTKKIGVLKMLSLVLVEVLLQKIAR